MIGNMWELCALIMRRRREEVLDELTKEYPQRMRSLKPMPSQGLTLAIRTCFDANYHDKRGPGTASDAATPPKAVAKQQSKMNQSSPAPSDKIRSA